ncbi:hypothetical protein FQR65_LT00777 [Abscondita terminalis]|nr:hypothetical protein FQR65_LT00777 [Abscondita terminalis]
MNKGAKVEKKKKKTNGYKLPDPLPLGVILEDIAKKKWKLGPSIGKGGFGEIYSAQEYPTTSKTYPYVIKIEPHANGPLFVEMHFYMRNAKREFIEEFMKKKKLKRLGMPTYLGSGRHEIGDQVYRFVVMEKFGTDIWKLFVENNNKFPPETVFKLGVQILDVLEYIHSKGYVHADVKGANVLLGLNSEASTQVYLVDFGLCTRYSQTDKPDAKKAHNGTLQYVSRDGHLGIESRRGDLEILGYNLIQWLGCNLPWDGKNLKSPTAVQESKEKYMKNLPDFFNVCFGNNKPPKAIVDYMEYVTSLKFDVEPNYQKLRDTFIAGIEAAGSSLDSPFNFKSQKTPIKRRIKESSPVKKEAIVKKNKINKPNPVNGAGKKSTKKTAEVEVSRDDSTEGFTPAMISIRNKMKSNTENDKEKINTSGRTLRSRKDVYYGSSSKGVSSPGSDCETVSPRNNRV